MVLKKDNRAIIIVLLLAIALVGAVQLVLTGAARAPVQPGGLEQFPGALPTVPTVPVTTPPTPEQTPSISVPEDETHVISTFTEKLGQNFDVQVSEAADQTYDLVLTQNQRQGIGALSLTSTAFNVKLYGIADPSDITNVKYADVMQKTSGSYNIRTPVFAMEIGKIKSATITLPKYGQVNAVLKCVNFDYNSNSCYDWEPTNVSFAQYSDSITFTVDSFSGYVGALDYDGSAPCASSCDLPSCSTQGPPCAWDGGTSVCYNQVMTCPELLSYTACAGERAGGPGSTFICGWPEVGGCSQCSSVPPGFCSSTLGCTWDGETCVGNSLCASCVYDASCCGGAGGYSDDDGVTCYTDSGCSTLCVACESSQPTCDGYCLGPTDSCTVNDSSCFCCDYTNESDGICCSGESDLSPDCLAPLGPPGEGTNVTNCTNLTDANTLYVLTENISGVQSGLSYCIKVFASNVTFDCQNNVMDGVDKTGNGVDSNFSVSNITIKNCEIKRYTNAITLGEFEFVTGGHNITNCTIWNNSNSGIDGGGTSVFDNNRIYLNTYGIYGSSNSGSNITNNKIYSNTQGLYLGTSSVLVKGNEIYNNTDGVYTSGGFSNTFIDNVLYNDSDWDFYIDGSTGTIVGNTTIAGLDASTYPTIINFTSSDYMAVKGVDSPSADPTGYRNVSKYVNATNLSAGAWLALNISYSTADLGGFSDSPLNMSKNNGSWQTNPASFANSYGFDAVNNYVYANITDFGSIFAPLGNATNITDCTNLTAADTVYTLGTDITGNQSDGRCIDIRADNVTLDCMGYNITGSYSGHTSGVYVSTYDNSTIRGCTLSNYSYGMNFSVNSEFNNITNNTVYNNTEGIFIVTCSNNNITDNIVYNTVMRGIYIGSASVYNNIIGNILYNNNYGIRLDAGQNNITGNTAYNNSEGISLNGVGENNLTNNTVYNNTQYGIHLSFFSVDNYLTNNNATNNGVDDFYSSVSSDNTIVNLTTNDTTSSFTYAGYIGVKSADGTGRADPTGYTNILHYLDITGLEGAWIYINISYEDSDMPLNMINSTITIWKNSSGQWWNDSFVGSPNGIDQANKIVYANITNFSSIFAPLGVARTVTNCTNLTVADAVYTLVANLSGNQSDGSCVNITADNVTIDCDGYNLTGTDVPNTYGIYAGGRLNIVIKNCYITDFESGIYLSSTNTSTLLNNTVLSNSFGLSVWYASNNNLTNNTVNDNQWGFDIPNSYNIILTNNTIIDNNARGISLGISSNNTLVNNTIINSTYAIYLVSVNNTRIINNTADNNTQIGINCDSFCYNNTIANNTVSNNNIYGIYFGLSDNNNLTNNTISNTTQTGIQFDSCSNNILTSNTISNNGVYGVYLYANSNDILVNNTANNNTDRGIYLESGSGNNLTNNRASYNTVWDLYSTSNSVNNIITNLTTNDTTSSFAYSGAIGIKSSDGIGRADPSGYANISHYLNITNSSAGAWVYINMSYEESNIPSSIIDNSTITIWKNSSGQWWNDSFVGSPNGIDQANKIVYANITNFGSVYAPMGQVTLQPNITVTIDGVSTDTFTYTAVPHTVVVNVTSNGVPVNNQAVAVSEKNGWNFVFPMLQEGYIYDAKAITTTNASGLAQFVIAPTKYNIGSEFNYSLSVEALNSSGDAIATKELSIAGTTVSPQTKTLPNINQLRNNMESWLSLALFLKSWVGSGKYNEINVTVNTTGEHTTLPNIKAGAINVINITLINSTTDSAVTGRIVPLEWDGFLLHVSTTPDTYYNHSNKGINITTDSLIYTMTTQYNINANYTFDVYDSNSNHITTLDFGEDSSLSDPGIGMKDLPSSVANTLKNQFESFLSVILTIRGTLLQSSETPLPVS